MENKKNPEEVEELEELEPIPEPAETENEDSTKQQEIPARQKKNRRLPPILRLSRRTTIFLSLTLTASILFFLSGNQQTFLDSNLKLLLQVISFNSIALIFFSFASSLECIYYLITEKKLRLVIHLAVYLLLLSASIAISVFSLSVNLLSEGISF